MLLKETHGMEITEESRKHGTYVYRGPDIAHKPLARRTVFGLCNLPRTTFHASGSMHTSNGSVCLLICMLVRIFNRSMKRQVARQRCHMPERKSKSMLQCNETTRRKEICRVQTLTASSGKVATSPVGLARQQGVDVDVAAASDGGVARERRWGWAVRVGTIGHGHRGFIEWAWRRAHEGISEGVVTLEGGSQVEDLLLDIIDRTV